MWSIYSLCPAPWGDQYRFVEAFDIEDDAKEVLVALEKVNILFHCYKIVEEENIQTNKRLRTENRRLEELVSVSAREIKELQSQITAMKN